MGRYERLQKDPEAVAALLDVLYSDRKKELSAWGIEGETYEVVDGRRYLMEGSAARTGSRTRRTVKPPTASGCGALRIPPPFPVATMESAVHLPPRSTKTNFPKGAWSPGTRFIRMPNAA